MAQETPERKCVTGSGKLSGEPVFCMFNVFFDEDLQASLLRHNNAWTNGMKDWLVQDPTHWKQLVADVPGRLASTNLDGRRRRRRFHLLAAARNERLDVKIQLAVSTPFTTQLHDA